MTSASWQTASAAETSLFSAEGYHHGSRHLLCCFSWLEMVTTRGQAGLVAAASAEAVAAAAEEAAAAEAASDAAAFDQHAADVEVFVEMGAEIMGKSPPSLLKKKQVTTTTAFEERWTAHFNAEPEVCFDVWQRLLEDNDDMENERPCHLLWALLYLQVYSTEPVLSGMCGCDEETFRSHVDTIVQKISFLEPDVVSCCSRMLSVGRRPTTIVLQQSPFLSGSTIFTTSCSSGRSSGRTGLSMMLETSARSL